MGLLEILQDVELFEGLEQGEIEQIALLCTERRVAESEQLTIQGEPGDELYIITQGFLEVIIGGTSTS